MPALTQSRLLPLVSNTTNTKMQPVNYRHSRRFACDHCRAYKLRCERDSRMSTSCNRCLSTSLACTTTAYPLQRRPGTAAPAPTPAQVQGQPTTDGRDGRDGSNNNTTTTTTMSNLPRSKEPRPSSNATRPIPPSQPNSNSTSTRIGQTQPAAGKDIISGSLPTPKSQGQSGPTTTPNINIMRHHLMDGGGGLSLDQDCLVRAPTFLCVLLWQRSGIHDNVYSSHCTDHVFPVGSGRDGFQHARHMLRHLGTSVWGGR